MTINVTYKPSIKPVAVKYKSLTAHGQFKITTGTLEHKIRNMLYAKTTEACNE